MAARMVRDLIRSRFAESTRGFVALVLLSLWAVGPAGEASQTWPLRNGEEYFGRAEQYDFATRDVTILKADGKEFTFPARDLAFSGKMQLMESPAFGVALKDYRPPFLATLTMILALVAAISLPSLIGLWTSANLFGSVVPVSVHLMGFLKIFLVMAIQVGVWLVAAIFLDSGGQPLLPDTNADIVMTLTVIVVGLLASSLVVAFHYHRSFWKGMAITCLAGVFAGIVALAMGLGVLYFATRMDYETLVTKTFLEPFAVF